MRQRILMFRSLSAFLLIVPALVAIPGSARADTAAPAPGCQGQGPLTIPTSPLVQNRFADALNRICTELRQFQPSALTDVDVKARASIAQSPTFDAAPLKAAASSQGKSQVEGALASLSALQKTCEAIALRHLEDPDLANLREFRKNLPDLLPALEKVRPQATTARELFSGATAHALMTELIPSGTVASVQDNLIRGLATFIADRAKAEAILYLSAQLQKELCEGEAKPYFKNVCVALQGADVKIQLAAMGTYLQAAALRDLEDLPDVMLDQAACEHPESTPEMSSARLGLAFFRETRAGREPLDLARNLQNVDLACARPQVDGQGQPVPGPCAKVFGALQLASRMLEALMQQYDWETLQLNQPDDPKWLHYTLGTLFSFEELQGSTLGTQEVNTRVSLVYRALHEAVAIENLLKQLRNKVDRKLPPKELAVPATRALALVTQLGMSGAAPSIQAKGPPAPSPLRTLAGVSELGQRQLEQQAPGQMAVALNGQLAQLQEFLPNLKLPPVVEHAIPFVVELANAQSSDEVAKALETAAAPVGSYRRKFERFTLSVNALVGFGAGYEWLDDRSLNLDGFSYEAFAPVGLSASWPLCRGAHAGVLLSVLDLGNLVSTRFRQELSKDPTSTSRVENPKVTLAQVLGPGVYGTLGLGFGTNPPAPLIVGFGFSVAPAARQVTTTTTDPGTLEPVTTTATHTVIRGSVFLAVDVTLFPF